MPKTRQQMNFFFQDTSAHAKPRVAQANYNAGFLERKKISVHHLLLIFSYPSTGIHFSKHWKTNYYRQQELK